MQFREEAEPANVNDENHTIAPYLAKKVRKQTGWPYY